MLPRQCASQKALLDYTEQKGLVYVWVYTQRKGVLSPAFIKRERVLSPDQYEIVDVRTYLGVRRAMLFPKTILQAEFEANREVLAMKREGWRAKRATTGQDWRPRSFARLPFPCQEQSSGSIPLCPLWYPRRRIT